MRVEMQFLADVFVPCEECDGRRFRPQVLEVRYKRQEHRPGARPDRARGAARSSRGSPKVLRRLQVLDEIGLGYLRLGQPATTLSGGEAQRIKIAAHLVDRRPASAMLYILDEPTTGLHFDDIAKLLAAFRKLLEAGHSLLVIEHNLDVIKTRRLGHRPRARRRRRRRPDRRGRHAGADRAASRLAHRPAPRRGAARRPDRAAVGEGALMRVRRLARRLQAPRSSWPPSGGRRRRSAAVAGRQAVRGRRPLSRQPGSEAARRGDADAGADRPSRRDRPDRAAGRRSG